jgi:glucose/arabinose dehydrogenase
LPFENGFAETGFKEVQLMNRQISTPFILILLAVLVAGCSATPTQTTAPAATTTTAAATPTPTTASTAATPSPSPSQAPSPSQMPSPTPVPAPTSVSLQVTDAYPNLTFKQPLLVCTTAPKSSELYVVERTGKIKVFADGPAAASTQTFLDLSATIISGGQEQGLLGLAFHPDYAKNGYFYVNYTNKYGTVIAQYRRSSTNNLAADPESGTVLLTFAQPYANHNGGNLAFGPDGYLYIATGDGGSAGDPQNNAQNLTRFLGKILRIDVNHKDSGTEYAIPADNPYAGNRAGYRSEIYAYGLRNPWRFSFDSAGRLWAGDVGQDAYEEIDIISKGGNYGWSAREGLHRYKNLSGIDPASLIDPIWEYKHKPDECITGGYVYNGAQIPALRGAYIYGDYVSGRIWSLWIDDQQTAHNDLLIDTQLKIASFGLDIQGELLIADLAGKIYRLTVAQ